MAGRAVEEIKMYQPFRGLTAVIGLVGVGDGGGGRGRGGN